MPAIKENNIPIVKSFINGFKNRYVISAPNTSDSPDMNVYKIAFILLFVE